MYQARDPSASACMNERRGDVTHVAGRLFEVALQEAASEVPFI